MLIMWVIIFMIIILLQVFSFFIVRQWCENDPQHPMVFNKPWLDQQNMINTIYLMFFQSSST